MTKETNTSAARPDNIFIVGCFRSGTTLLAALLDSHDEISFIACETKYMGGKARLGLRGEMRKSGDLSQDENAIKLAENIYSDAGSKIRGCFRWLREHVNRDEFLQKLLESDRSDRSIFKIILDFHASLFTNGKAIVGEKTGAHIYHLPTLLEWFPGAKFVHILRDPRAVLASQLSRKGGYLKINRKSGASLKKYSKFPMKLFNPLITLLEVMHVYLRWHGAASLHAKYEKQYPQNYTIIKYEDLLNTPESSLKKLCNFLSVDFSEEMLQAKIINSSFRKNYTGNDELDAKDGFDTQAITRWKSALPSWIITLTNLFMHKYLKKFGYV